MALGNLDKHLSDWQSQGLLSPEQADRIRQFEADRAPQSRLLTVLTILAVLSIGLGIISLIAANWNQIPAWFKLFSYFSLMLAQVYALFRWDHKPGLVREGLYFLYILSILAGIGLIAQVFHVPSDGWRGPTLWSVLSLGLMLRARTEPSVLLWFAGFTWAWLGFVFQSSTHEFVRLQCFMASVAVLCIGASWNGHWKLPEPQRSLTLHLGSLFVLVAGPWCLLARSSQDVRSGIDFAVAVLLAAVWLFVLARQLKKTLLVAAGIVALGFFARWWIADLAQRDLLEQWPNFLDTIAFTIQLSAMGLFALHWDRGRIFDGLTLLMAARIFTLFFTLFGTLFMTGAGLVIFGIIVLGLLRVWYCYHDRLQSRLKELLQ
jgi:uncharacterized membrane protein